MKDGSEHPHGHKDSDAPRLGEWDARRWGLCPQTGFALAHAGAVAPGCKAVYQCDLCGEFHTISAPRGNDVKLRRARKH